MDEEFFNQIDNLGELLDHSVKEKLAPDTLICECFCVNVQDIRHACSELGTVDFKTLQQVFGLGTGCGSCLKNSDSWKSRIF
jgi:NAD(P)H-nitrite reductase large subunit